MSYGTRKAIAGVCRATEKAISNSESIISSFEACNSIADVRCVLADMKQIDFFYLPPENSKKMRDAFDRANERCSI